jgi:hypothetical protein
LLQIHFFTSKKKTSDAEAPVPQARPKGRQRRLPVFSISLMADKGQIWLPGICRLRAGNLVFLQLLDMIQQRGPTLEIQLPRVSLELLEQMILDRLAVQQPVLGFKKFPFAHGSPLFFAFDLVRSDLVQ